MPKPFTGAKYQSQRNVSTAMKRFQEWVVPEVGLEPT